MLESILSPLSDGFKSKVMMEKLLFEMKLLCKLTVKYNTESNHILLLVSANKELANKTAGK